jgi:hypothetical protein
MLNNNLADISMFESLQSDQHNRTDMSSMSVFNDIREAVDLGNKYVKCVKGAIAAEKARIEYEFASKRYRTQTEDPKVAALLRGLEKKAKSNPAYDPNDALAKFESAVAKEVKQIRAIADPVTRKQKAAQFKTEAYKIYDDARRLDKGQDVRGALIVSGLAGLEEGLSSG